MAKVNILKKLGSLVMFASTVAILVCTAATLSKSYSFRPFLLSDTSSCNYETLSPNHRHRTNQTQIKNTVQIVIHKIQRHLDHMKENSRDEESEHASFLADILGLIGSVNISLSVNSEQNLQGTPSNLLQPSEYFLTEEIRKYVKTKPNRLQKPNFMGTNGTSTSIGQACFSMRKLLEDYMDYDVGDICEDDWKLAQQLMVNGCDPLPRRRCFARAPQFYTKPLPVNESMWGPLNDKNVRWSQYRCKNFTCLVSNATTSKKGFSKCTDCFDLAGHEYPRWVEPVYQDPNSNTTSDFTITEVLDLKPGEIRIGLDFSVGTGTFAARMKEKNVTIVSVAINLGAPFSEVIALRGLIPIYLTINQRLPFFDNTLDLIHTTRFLDGWIDFVTLDFVLYDWDRVLRPGGILWVDSFFCLKEDLSDYLDVFKMLRYRKHMWVVVPKWDKSDDREVFFSAVLEKPPRPF
ncbi:hypothetical protein ABFS82_02G168600 [Erythranthe guttata]|nr:hypothetical protein MIMGU_mgv1a024581mg [Erythranthe guttata]